MLQHKTDLQKNIDRSLSHLRTLVNQKQTNELLPALSYTVHISSSQVKLLLKYAQNASLENHDYSQQLNSFHIFNELLGMLAKKDLTNLKNNQAKILDEIYTDVSQQLFQRFLRPDIQQIRHTHRSTMKKIQQQNEENGQIIYASKYAFDIPQKEIAEGLKNSKIRQKPIQIEVLSTDSNGMNMYDQLWESIQRHYRDHNIDEAHIKLKQFESKIQNFDKLPKYRQELINTINMQYQTMTKFYSQFQQTGWIHDKTEKGISLQYKIDEQSKQIAIRIHAECDIEIQNFLAIISQIDLMGQYVPFCYDSKHLKAISRNQRIGTSKIYIPLLSDRQTYFYAAGYNRISTKGSVFLFSKTINQDLAYQQKYKFKVPQPNPDFVRLQYKFFIVQYVPITRFRAKIRLASKVDMKLNFLPMFILNRSARTFAFDYFKNILKRSKNFKGSEWQKKVQQNPELYNFFKQQINQYLK